MFATSEQMADRPSPKRFLHSLNHALDLLEQLGHEEGDLGVTELAARLGLSKAAVHGIVANLESRHYVRKTPGTMRYQLGHRAWELGVAAGERIELRGIARQHLTALTALTGESSQLSEYDGGEVLYLDKVASLNPVQAVVRIGGRAPAYCVATGKVLLAFQPKEEVDAVCARPFMRYTEHTITDPHVLRMQLEEIRARGWAINRGEYRGEIVGLAAPVRDFSGQVIASISISGPSYRFSVEHAETFAKDIVSAASAISRKLGFNREAA